MKYNVIELGKLLSNAKPDQLGVATIQL